MVKVRARLGATARVKGRVRFKVLGLGFLGLRF
jgi:hypothetical protein